MPNTPKKLCCEFCTFGSEVTRVCGKLWTQGNLAAHHKCMQYSSGLGQYKDEFSDFGNFDPKEVRKEIKRGKKLKCNLCKNRHGSATSGCALAVCPHSFHYLCAKQDPNRTTLVKKLRKEQDNTLLDEYVIFCKNAHMNSYEAQKKNETFWYVESSDEDDIFSGLRSLGETSSNCPQSSYKVSARKRASASASEGSKKKKRKKDDTSSDEESDVSEGENSKSSKQSHGSKTSHGSKHSHDDTKSHGRSKSTEKSTDKGSISNVVKSSASSDGKSQSDAEKNLPERKPTHQDEGKGNEVYVKSVENGAKKVHIVSKESSNGPSCKSVGRPIIMRPNGEVVGLNANDSDEADSIQDIFGSDSQFRGRGLSSGSEVMTEAIPRLPIDPIKTKKAAKHLKSSGGDLLHAICRRISSSEEFETPPVKQVKGRVTVRKHRKIPRRSHAVDSKMSSGPAGSDGETKSDGATTDGEAKTPPPGPDEVRSEDDQPFVSFQGAAAKPMTTTMENGCKQAKSIGPVISQVGVSSVMTKTQVSRALPFSIEGVVSEAVGKVWQEAHLSQEGVSSSQGARLDLDSVFTQELSPAGAMTQPRARPGLNMESVYTQELSATQNLPLSTSKLPTNGTQLRVPPTHIDLSCEGIEENGKKKKLLMNSSDDVITIRDEEQILLRKKGIPMESVFTQEMTQQGDNDDVITITEDRQMDMESVFTQEFSVKPKTQNIYNVDTDELEPGEISRTYNPSRNVSRHMETIRDAQADSNSDQSKSGEPIRTPKAQGTGDSESIFIDPNDGSIKSITAVCRAQQPDTASVDVLGVSEEDAADWVEEPMSPSLLSSPSKPLLTPTTSAASPPQVLQLANKETQSVNVVDTPESQQPYVYMDNALDSESVDKEADSPSKRVIGEIVLKVEKDPLDTDQTKPVSTSPNFKPLLAVKEESDLNEEQQSQNEPADISLSQSVSLSQSSFDSQNLRLLSPLACTPDGKMSTPERDVLTPPRKSRFVGDKEVSDLRRTFDSYIEEASKSKAAVVTSTPPKREVSCNEPKFSPKITGTCSLRSSIQDEKAQVPGSPKKSIVHRSISPQKEPKSPVKLHVTRCTTPPMTGSPRVSPPRTSQGARDSPQRTSQGARDSPQRDQGFRSADAVLCVCSTSHVRHTDKDAIYQKGRELFNVRRHQVLMKLCPPTGGEVQSEEAQLRGLLHVKHILTALRDQDLQTIQKLALDRSMLPDETSGTETNPSATCLTQDIKSLVAEISPKYPTASLHLEKLSQPSSTETSAGLTLMLRLNDTTDPGYKVRDKYNNIFVWHPLMVIDKKQVLCDPEREYATLASWLDKQAPEGSIDVYPSDPVLLGDKPNSVTQRLSHHLQKHTGTRVPKKDQKHVKVCTIGPLNHQITPAISPYLHRCIPHLVEMLVTSERPCLLCVIDIDSSVSSIKDVCAPLVGYDMNIVTAFGPSEFSPSCFVLKVLKRP